MRVRSSYALAALVGLSVFLGLPAWPAMVTIDPALFGHLNQNDPALAGVCAAGGVSYACGPVAATNSFVFLQNRYPTIYDNLLTGGNLVNTATTLGSDAFMMCSACTGGTLLSNFITGKQKYIESKVPGLTTYASLLNPGFPFLLGELQQNEDVELLLGFYDAMNNRVGGHYVTLYGVSGAGDPQALSFVDPAGGVNQPNLAYVVVGGVIQVLGYGPAGSITRIDAAVAESPVPEPGTLTLLLFAVPVLWAKRAYSRNT
jgi:hypothetical protein